MSEEMKKMLDAVLASPYVRKARGERDVKDEIEFYGHRRRLIDFVKETIDEFLSENLEEVIKVEAVWKWLCETLKEDIDWILCDKKDFVDRIHWTLESEAQERLSNLTCRLTGLLVAQHREAWQKSTLEDAKAQLSGEKGIFVALLDREGKLLDEPYPITVDTSVHVDVTVEEDFVTKARKNVVARFKTPTTLGTSKTKVNALFICRLPKKFAKAEVLRFP